MILLDYQIKEISAQNFKTLRKDLGLTQKRFSEELGISIHALGSYEDKRAMTPVHIVLRLCKIFNISMEDFFTKKI